MHGITKPKPQSLTSFVIEKEVHAIPFDVPDYDVTNEVSYCKMQKFSMSKIKNVNLFVCLSFNQATTVQWIHLIWAQTVESAESGHRILFIP